MYDADRLPVNSMAGTLGTAGHKVVLLESVSTDCFAFRFLLGIIANGRGRKGSQKDTFLCLFTNSTHSSQL